MHLTNNYIVDIIKSSATGTAFLQNNNKHITKTLKMHKNAFFFVFLLHFMTLSVII